MDSHHTKMVLYFSDKYPTAATAARGEKINQPSDIYACV